jgi:heme A synthase
MTMTNGSGGSGPAARSDASRPRPLTRDQRTTVVYGILCFILILVVLQLWLLIATMNAYLGEDEAPIWPAAAASVVCLLLNLGLLRYLYAVERQ